MLEASDDSITLCAWVGLWSIACGHLLLLLLVVPSWLDDVGPHFYDLCVILLGCCIVD